MSVHLLKPLLTEKSIAMAQKGVYTFLVSVNSTKTQIKKAVNELFEVETREVKTINVKGENKRVGRTRRKISEPSLKKALIMLKNGQKINVFEFEEAKKEDKKDDK